MDEMDTQIANMTQKIAELKAMKEKGKSNETRADETLMVKESAGGVLYLGEYTVSIGSSSEIDINQAFTKIDRVRAEIKKRNLPTQQTTTHGFGKT